LLSAFVEFQVGLTIVVKIRLWLREDIVVAKLFKADFLTFFVLALKSVVFL